LQKYKYEINDQLLHLKEMLLDIKKYFDSSTDSIHKARNEIKIINYHNQDLVIKSFKIPHLFNRIIYTFFRKSKAYKSYHYSLKIGDFTPKPIGYIEFYKSGLLEQSFFVSQRFDYDFTIREPLLDSSFANKEEILRSFARFTHDLHEAGIYHQDFSPGNILIKKIDDKYEFKIVDINRMEFRKLCFNLRMKSFSKLWAKDEDLEIIIKAYSKISGANEEFLVKKAIAYSHSLKFWKNLKKRVKGQKVVD